MLHKFTLQQSLGKSFDIHITDSGRIMCPDKGCSNKEICKHIFLASSSNNQKKYWELAEIRIPGNEILRINNAWNGLPWHKRNLI